MSMSVEKIFDNNWNVEQVDNNLPLISVIILTYKQQNYLFDTIKSVLEQDYPSLELILSDDASGCLHEEAVEEYIVTNKKDNLVSYQIRINETNMGTVKHANCVVQCATGKYLKFVPCGDKFFSTDSLSKLYKFAKANDSQITSSIVMVCSEDFSTNYYQYPNAIRSKMLQEYSSEGLFKKLCVSNFIAAISVLFRKDFFDIFNFDERYQLLEDWPLWLQVCRSGTKIYHFNEVTMYYADGGISRKDGDAYASSALRDDMIKCFELDIIPYSQSIGFISKQFIYYKYESLKKKSRLFHIKYAPFLIWDQFKYSIKSLIKFIS